jgi:hypothetical protein
VTDAIDLETASLEAISRIGFRTDGRDFFADEAVVWGRFTRTWDGLTDSEWYEPGAAPSSAGGPDWSMLDHVAHVAWWQEMAISYIPRALDGEPWPAEADFSGGDFDAFNERQRVEWSSLSAAEVRARLIAGHERLVAIARRVPPDVLVSEAVFPWVFLTLHGHQIDHIGVLEPWAATLRARRGGAGGSF